MQSSWVPSWSWRSRNWKGRAERLGLKNFVVLDFVSWCGISRKRGLDGFSRIGGQADGRCESGVPDFRSNFVRKTLESALKAAFCPSVGAFFFRFTQSELEIRTRLDNTR